MTPARARILVIRGGAIGDFILTLPALAALRQQFPDAHLELLAYEHIAELARAGGLVDAVRAIDARPLAGFFARHGTLAPELEEYFAGFALALSYLYDPDGIFQANVARCGLTHFISGPHRPDERQALHATEVFLQPLERLAIFGADPVPRLRLEPAGAVGRRIAVHPGSGSERKNWPEPCWADLLDQLTADTPAELLLVGGEAEGGRLERLARRLPVGRFELARNLPLVELARRLAECRAFVGHDSGITHLAAALNLPSCVLWGESNQAIWRPRGDNARLLRHPEGLAALAVQQVFEALREWTLAGTVR